MKAKQKRALIAVMAIICISILCICIIVCYTKMISRSIEQDKKTYVQELTIQATHYIDDKIKNESEKIENMSKLLIHGNGSLEDEFLTKFQNTYTRQGFQDIALLDPSGEGTTITRQRVNYKNYAFFDQALHGKTVLYSLMGENEGISSYLYATPVFKGADIVAILCGYIDAEDFISNIDYKFYNNHDMLFLFDVNNEEVIHQFFGQNDNTKPAFGQTLQGTLNNKDREKLFSSLSMNKNGISIIKNDKDNAIYYMGYSPLRTKGWYVLSFISGNEIKIKTNNIQTNTFIFLGIMMTCMIAFATFLLIIYQRAKERIRKTKLELETVIKNIPGGVVRFLYDDCLTIHFLNDGLLKLTGFTKCDIEDKLGNSFLNLVHDKDREELASAIVDQMTMNKTVEINCRLKCANGKYSWFLFKGRMLTNDLGSQTCLCVLTDINEAKQAQQELNLSVQRYHIITEQSDSIIFEYSFIGNSLYLSDKWYKKFAPISLDTSFYDYLISSQLIKTSDLPVIKKIRDNVVNGTVYNEGEFRLLTISNHYIWCRVRMSSIFDENQKVCKIVGKIIDIDEQKRETENLKKKAELDSLSGLYNKETTQMLISDFLANKGKDGIHALMILDIDNFKSINDNLGHLVGDAVIRNITTRLKDVVRASDICGRIGGDEFVILLKNVKSNDIVKSKASEICSAFRYTICNNNKNLNISCSIGISFYDRHGTTYHELLDKADTALYEAKKQGKDQLAVYGIKKEQ